MAYVALIFPVCLLMIDDLRETLVTSLVSGGLW